MIDPDGMAPYDVQGAVIQDTDGGEDETQKSVVNKEEQSPGGREPVPIDVGYGTVISDMLTTGVDYAGNFETDGGRKSGDCCGKEKSNQKTSKEINRENVEGYGYTGAPEIENNQRWNMFESLPGGKYFHNTGMGKDIEAFISSKTGKGLEIVINRGLELVFLIRNVPWLLNDPVIPPDFPELENKLKLKL